MIGLAGEGAGDEYRPDPVRGGPDPGARGGLAGAGDPPAGRLHRLDGPRGIVAAATASTFAATLAAHHVGGASKILAVTFLVIVATVALYGLTAVPVAHRLGVTRPARTRPLLVGGDPWVIDLARAFRAAALPYRIVVPPRSLIVKPWSACLSATSMSS